MDLRSLLDALIRVLVLALALTASATAPALDFTLKASSAADLSLPHDIVLSADGERLYVADNGNNRVAVLDAMSLALLGSLGDGELREPHDVVFDTRGQLLVADTGNSRIAIYRLSEGGSSLVGELKGGMSRPEGVAVHRDGRVFATGAGSGNVVIYNGGRVTGQAGGFSSPHDVEFAPDGALWLADASNNRVVQLDDSLNITRELAGARYGFNGPRYLDFDTEGRMLVADKYTHRVLVIEPGGSITAIIGSGRAGKGANVFDRPEGVEIRGQDLWLSDTYNNRIVRYRITP